MIHVLGANGMLGRYVYTYLVQNFNCHAVTRAQFDVVADLNNLDKLHISKNDVVVNCIGVIKPQIDKLSAVEVLTINSLFPKVLAKYCRSHSATLYHVTTDCIFDGKLGGYNEAYMTNAIDLYGLSKYYGESADCSIIRTSIIGEEVSNSRSLVEWLKKNKGQPITGFTNHLWNGITCLQFAKIIEKSIESHIVWSGVRHFHSNTVTKAELVTLISQIYNLDLQITPKPAPTAKNMTLDSLFYLLLRSYKIPPIKQQIEEMYRYYDRLHL